MNLSTLTFIFAIIIQIASIAYMAVVTNRPYASFTGFTIGKELINDKLLNRGTPDILDVRANSLGVLKYYLEK